MRPSRRQQPVKTLRLFLKYGPHGEKLITGIERISRPGRRVYFGTRRCAGCPGGPRHQHPDDVARRDDGRRAAVKAGVGGEVLCNIW